MKRRFFFWAKKKINSNNIRLVILLILMVIILTRKISADSLSLSHILDTEILFSVILLAICDAVARIILSFIQKKCEDAAKVTTDYASLVKKYAIEDLMEYQENKFPVVCQWLRREGASWDIKIEDDPKSQYRLPSQIAGLSGEIMGAHSQSVIYNQINIRLNDVLWDEGNRTLTLNTGRTYYFDSMVTNRAADYQLSNGKTVREIYEPGPYIQSLRQSRMSNHLGYNGFVKMKDGKIPFVVRGKKLSIGKGTLGTSIGASLKSKFAIKREAGYLFTQKGLGEAILYEIADELALCPTKDALEYFEEKNITHDTAVNSIFAVYRDLVECGKPQLLFFMELDFLTSEELLKVFKAKNKERSSGKEDKVKRDGKKLVFFTVEQLKKATITADTLKIGKKSYVMMPSASASIVMLLEHIKNDAK